MIELDLNSSHKMTEQGQPLQRQMRETLDKMMREKLCSKPDIAKQIIPDFPVACKRLTPGPGMVSLGADYLLKRLLMTLVKDTLKPYVPKMSTSIPARLYHLRRMAL